MGFTRAIICAAGEKLGDELPEDEALTCNGKVGRLPMMMDMIREDLGSSAWCMTSFAGQALHDDSVDKALTN